MSLFNLVGTDDNPNIEEEALPVTPLVPTKIPYMIQDYTHPGALVYFNVGNLMHMTFTRKNDIVTLHINNNAFQNTGANLANVRFVVLFDQSFIDSNNNPLPPWVFPDFTRNIDPNFAFPANFVTGSTVVFHNNAEMFGYCGFTANADGQHWQFRVSFGGYRLDDGTNQVENINNNDTITIETIHCSWIGVPI